MASPQHLIGFLNSQTFERPRGEPAPGSRPFVTISRQAGAGGRTLAQALMAVFARRGDPALKGWQWADRPLCESLAADTRLGVTLQSLLDERFRGGVEDFLTAALTGTAPQLSVHRALFSAIRSLAGVGRVILIGRGGVCATRGYSGGVNVRLVAPRPARVRRVMRANGWDIRKAETWLDRQDRDRARLLKVYFAADVDDPLLYDLVVNTELTAPEAAAEAVTALVLARAHVEASV